MSYLIHHGILGQKWGHMNGPPYPLDDKDYSKLEKKLNRADKRFVRKNDKKIRRYAEKSTKSEMKEYDKQLRKAMPTRTKRGKVASNYATAYNKKLAELMNQAIGDIETPSGRVVRFVAQRGEIGVYTALADRNYDLGNLRNGIYNSGKVAYRKQTVDKIDPYAKK